MTNNNIFDFTFETFYGCYLSLRSQGRQFHSAAAKFRKDLFPYLTSLNL